MPQFILTARNTINPGGGQRVEKGMCFTVNIFQQGVNPNFLFSGRYSDVIRQQLDRQGLAIAPGMEKYYITKGAWDVKML